MYGSDLWEYLSVERWISLGGILPYHSTFIKYVADGNNLHVGLYSLNVMFSKLLQLDLYWPTLMSVVLLLSVFIPLLMYQIGKKIYNNDVYALILAYLPSFLYDTLSWRSLSSANGLGVLITLFALLFWTVYLTDERIPTLFPILITGSAIFAYPLTGIIAAEFALFSIFLRRHGTKKLSKTIFVVLTVSFILPTILLVSGTCTLASIRPWETVLNRFIYPSERSPLNRLLDLPYMFVYVMTIYGLLIGRKNIKSEVYTMFSAFLVILMSNSIFTDLANMPSLRVTTTILPYFYLFFAGIAIRELYDKCTKHIHISLALHAKKLRIPTLKLSAIVMLFILAVGPSAIYIFMPYRGPNPSRYQIEAINYILNEDKSHSSLILADYLTLVIINAEANGSYYSLPQDQSIYALTGLAFPMYKKLMGDPTREIFIEAENVIEGYLRRCGVNTTVSHCYVVCDTVISELYGINPEKSLSKLENLFGKPKVFGNVFVFSGYIPQKLDNGWITQLDKNTMIYDVAFNDFNSLLSESTVEGTILYDTKYEGILIFKTNSSLTIKIDTKHKIINASLSCSIYRYNEDDNVFIQVSVDGSNYLTVWITNTTRMYLDLIDLPLTSLLSGYDSFYLKFGVESRRQEDYSMAVRNYWNNALSGIKLKIYTYA